MPNDFKQKEPSKTEKMLYQLALNQQETDRHVMSNSAQILALAYLLNVDPEKFAKLISLDDPKLKEYGKKINEHLEKYHKEQHPDHNHEHSEDGHVHGN